MEDKMAAKGNLIKNIIAEFDTLSYDELVSTTFTLFSSYMQVFTVRKVDQRIFEYMFIFPARIGTYYDGKLNAKEKKFIKSIYSDFYVGPFEEVYSMISTPINDLDFNMIKGYTDEKVAKYGTQFPMTLLRLIIAFAICDGVIEDDLSEMLEKYFSLSLMVDFFRSGQESVPSAGELISGTEADIVKWLEEDDRLAKKDDIQKEFSHIAKATVTKTLNSLIKKGIVFKSNTIAGEMYGLSGEPYRIGKSTSKAQTEKNRKKEEDIEAEKKRRKLEEEKDEKQRIEDEELKYNKQVDAVKKKREDLLNELLINEEKRLKRDAEYTLKITKNKFDTTLKEQATRKEQAQNELGQLGIFSFSRKSELKKMIKDCESEMQKATDSIKRAEESYESEINAIPAALRGFREIHEKIIKNENPMPKRPDSMKLKIEQIYQYMHDHYNTEFTAKQLQEHFKEYDISISEMENMLTEMRSKVLVYRQVIAGKTYYMAI